MKKEALADLAKILSESQIKSDAQSLQYYAKDWTSYYDIKASLILFPTKIEQVKNIVLWARRNQFALVPSGGRTGLSGGACAIQNEVVVSFEKMNRILEFNEFDFTVQVEAGVITEALQKFAQVKNLFYPVDFAARGSSQIGGNIATNAGGIRVIKYGMTRDWVVGLTVVTGKGEVLKLNRGLVKNATGLDFRHLFIGSEGILGFIVEATMKLCPPPRLTKVIYFAAEDLAKIMNVFRDFKNEFSVLAFEFFSEMALQKVIHHRKHPRVLTTVAPFYVVTEIELSSDGDETKLLTALEKQMEAGNISDGTISQSETQAQQFWKHREEISESLSVSFPYKNDISVKVSNIPALVQELEKILIQHYPDFEVIWFGHIGDGNLHINILRPATMAKEKFVQECQKVDRFIFESVKNFEGSISAEHGVGLLKRPFLFYTRSLEEIELLKAVKKAFDPDLIMNPGKII